MIKVILKRILMLNIFILFTMSCKKDIKSIDNNIAQNVIVEEQNKRFAKVVTTATLNAFLHGNILDENGNPLSGVEVTVSGKTITTDNDGYFVFNEISLNKDYAVVKAVKSDYMKGARTFTPMANAINRIEIRLQKKGVPQTIDAVKGGELTFDGGKVKLNFPANSIANTSGELYEGFVQVHARYIDPEGEEFASLMPGMLIGLTDENQMLGMTSYGIVNVELSDNNGQPLQVAGGKKVAVTIPAIMNAPEDMPIWHFNETYSLWVEAGKAVKSGEQYTFEANHFSFWNIDVCDLGATYNVVIQLESPSGNPIVDQEVDIYTPALKYLLRRAYTDSYGRISLRQMPRSIELRINSLCQKVSENIEINSSEIKVRLNVSAGNTKIYHLKGLVKDCEDKIYDNKDFMMKGIGNGISFIGTTDAHGKFDKSVVLCDINPGEKYKVAALLYISDNEVKKDTFEVIFDGTFAEVEIDFCRTEIIADGYLNPNLTYGTVEDIDGNVYATIKIGDKIWMAENLKTTRYNDGTPILFVTDNSQLEAQPATGAYFYYNNDASYNKLYGKLYNWYAVNTGKLCPEGWQMPAGSIYDLLGSYLGDSIAGKMKTVIGWESPNAGATNSTGFSALPGGIRLWSRSEGIGMFAEFWVTNELSSQPSLAYSKRFGYASVHMSTASKTKETGLSCRCIKK